MTARLPHAALPAEHPAAALERRVLSIALGISLLLHAAVLAAQLRMPFPARSTEPMPETRLVYESAAARPVQKVAAAAPAPSPAALVPPTAPSAARPGSGWDRELAGADADGPRITVGGAGAARAPGASTRRPEWAAAIDLTNLTAAAQGNPVLLSYFSVVRERIQQAAGSRVWVPESLGDEGIVYVGFLIERSGRATSVQVVDGRSASSNTLRGAAVRIVQAARQFPELPPSVEGPSLMLLVPIEFSFGPRS